MEARSVVVAAICNGYARRIVIKFFTSAKADTKSLSTRLASSIVPRYAKTKRAHTIIRTVVYGTTLALIVFVVSFGYRPDGIEKSTASLDATQTEADIAKPSVDQLAVAGLTAKTADVANLSVAADASNAAITLAIKSELAQQDEAVITKPQTFEPTSSSAIVTYKSVAGDTAQSIAARYGVSAQTVRWANNMTGDAVVPGADMIIPTVDGVVRVVKDGDTLDSLASKYKSDKARIVSKNDLELASGLPVGQRIVLPGGELPANEQPGYVAPRRTTSAYSAVSSSNPLYTAQAGNRYTYGTCTWYAYNRRAQLGRPIGSFWGNAASWSYAAAAAGYTVTRGNPGVGDIMQNGGGYGHVAVVESLLPGGGVRVSEMNYHANGGGWNIISYRDIDAGSVGSYSFIK